MAIKIDPKPIREFIRENNGVLSTKEIARQLGVSDAYISQQRAAMGLKAIRVASGAKKLTAGETARRVMIKEAMAGEFSLGWLRKPWTAEGVAS